MFLSRIPVHLLLFLCAVTPATVRSFHTYTPLPADCHSAIVLIPSGTFTVDTRYASPDGKLDLQFPSQPDRQKYLIPGAFHHGTCAIVINAYDSKSVQKPPPPYNAASQMYSVVWPHVREVAEGVVEKCRKWNVERQPWRGSVLTESMLGEEGEYEYPYWVSVVGTPRELPEDRGQAMRILTPKYLRRRVEYHVYEAGKGGGTGGKGGGGEGEGRGG
ncbi:hypothetical protein MMC30_001013 [Trapelia coarctata]|nr:hypothetical protein [Trapelia coarctata]